MATQAFVGRGAQLYRGDVAAATNFVKVTEVVSIGAIGGENPQIVATHLESDEAEYVSGLPDTEDIACVANWRPTDSTQDEVTGVIADRQDGTSRYWQVVWKKLGVIVKRATFQATVSAARVSETSNTAVAQLNFTLKRSGATTWANS